MPTVTSLELSSLRCDCQSIVLNRCRSAQRLCVSSPLGGGDTPPNPELIILPNVSHLYLTGASRWPHCFRLSLPSIQYSEVNETVSEDTSPRTDLYVTDLEHLLTSGVLDKLAHDLHRVSVSCYREGLVAVQIEDLGGKTIVKLNVRFKPVPASISRSMPSPKGFLGALLRFVKSQKINIYSINIQDTNEWRMVDLQCVLYTLQGCSGITEMRIRDAPGLVYLLLWPSWGHDIPLMQYAVRNCTCGSSRDTLVASYPGLKTLVLGDVGDGKVSIDWDVFVGWLEERERGGMGLETLVFEKDPAGGLDPRVFDRISRVVGTVVVRKCGA